MRQILVGELEPEEALCEPEIEERLLAYETPLRESLLAAQQEAQAYAERISTAEAGVDQLLKDRTMLGVYASLFLSLSAAVGFLWLTLQIVLHAEGSITGYELFALGAGIGCSLMMVLLFLKNLFASRYFSYLSAQKAVLHQEKQLLQCEEADLAINLEQFLQCETTNWEKSIPIPDSLASKLEEIESGTVQLKKNDHSILNTFVTLLMFVNVGMVLAASAIAATRSVLPELEYDEQLIMMAALIAVMLSIALSYFAAYKYYQYVNGIMDNMIIAIVFSGVIALGISAMVVFLLAIALYIALAVLALALVIGFFYLVLSSG